MLQTFGAMLAIVTTWLMLVAVFLGWGLLVRRVTGFHSAKPRSFFLSFWVGWGATIPFLQLWHFILPTDGWACSAVVAIGVASLACRGQFLREMATRLVVGDPPIPRWMGITVVATILFCANLAVGPPRHYDTGLYHMQAVRWNSAHAITPGLGNLNARLAFNNSSFLYAAMLDAGPWATRSHHVANGLLVMVLMVQLLSHLPGAFRPTEPGWVHHAWLALLLPATVIWSCKEISSLTPDLVSYLLGVVVTSELFLLMLGGDAESDERRFSFFAICLLSAVGLTIKQSFAPLGMVSSLLAAGTLIIGERRERLAARVLPAPSIALAKRMNPWRALIAVSIAGGLTLIPWAVRGVILSGYIAYPQSIGTLDVAWRIPLEDLVEMRDHSIVAWHRNKQVPPGEVLGNLSWVGGWLVNCLRDVFKVDLPLAMLVIGAIAAWRSRRDSRPDHGAGVHTWLVLLPSLATMGFVVFTAPNPRFAGAAIWMLGVGAFVLAWDRFARDDRRFQTMFHVTRMAGGALLVLVLLKAARFTTLSGTDHGFVPTPEAAVISCETNSGLVVHIPEHGDQLWDAPLLSTLDFEPQLAVRRQGDPGSGFVLAPGEPAATAKRLLGPHPVVPSQRR